MKEMNQAQYGYSKFEDTTIVNDLSQIDTVYFLAGAKIRDKQCGDYVYSPIAVPKQLLMVGGQNDPNRASINKNGSTIEIQERNVIPAYTSTNTMHTIITANAVSNNAAQYLVLGEDSQDNRRFYIQSSGKYEFPEGHDYIVGEDYYLGENGDVTTQPGEFRQFLFTVPSSKEILINISPVEIV